MKYLLLALTTVISLEIGICDVVFDDSVGLGRRFDGIGGLSGGGATSKLLVNYPEKERNEVLDYLFKPKFGASLQILKVEIGGDAQSTDGTEASHMHNSWDENYNRGYEWWLMKEAKKRNPNIKLYGLPWTFPGWVGAGTRSPYSDPELTSRYIIKWILGAKSHHNLTIDFIGIWNERNYNIVYIKTLRRNLDKNGLRNTRIVAADGGWGIATDITKDSQLASSIDFIGCHYPGTESTVTSYQTGKPLWSSEDYSTYNDNTGAGCWARILNQNYVNGYMTSTISWNLIASYYQNLPFYRDGLMTATQPWGGNYLVNGPIWISAHTTQFTEIGWKYLKHRAGVGHLESGGSYVGLVSPDGKDLTIVIETMSHDHSKCIRPQLPPYKVSNATVQLQMKGSFASLKELNVWFSKPSFGSDPDVYFMKQKPLKVVNGVATINVLPDEVWTLTTLSRGQKGSFGTPPPSRPFPLPYFDDFEGNTLYMEPKNLAQQTGSYEVVMDPSSHKQVIRQMVLDPPVSWCKAEVLNTSLNIVGTHDWASLVASSMERDNTPTYAYQIEQEPYNLVPQVGCFEVHKTLDHTHHHVMRQVVLTPPIGWCPVNLDFPITVAGNGSWTDIYAEVDVQISTVNGSEGVFIAARVNQGGCNTFETMGIFLFVFPADQTYVLTNDLARTIPITSGKLTNFQQGWSMISITVKGKTAIGTFNAQQLFNVDVPNKPTNGFVGIGTSSWGLADFDNLKINPASDHLQQGDNSKDDKLYFVPGHQ